MVTAKNPVNDQDPIFVKCLNHLISNTIEQSLVFGCLFAYWLNFVASKPQIKVRTADNQVGPPIPVSVFR
jgi:hypothetical protein